MRLYHVSPVRNLESIYHKGILLEFSCQFPQVTYLCTRRKVKDLISHMAIRHQVEVNEIAVFTVEIVKFNLKKTPWNGVYRYSENIHPARIVRSEQVDVDLTAN